MNWTGSTGMPVTEAVRPGTLYVVATPIGNLEDLTFRALRILREVDLVAAEDTRHSRKLFNHYGVNTPLVSCFAHNELRRSEEILGLLAQGRAVALISDAGTPAISDPGFLLVRRCREDGYPVVPVPGPSAVIAALSAAGQPVERFAFEGFLPSRAAARRSFLEEVAGEARSLVFYEAPHRLLATLRELAADLRRGAGADRGPGADQAPRGDFSRHRRHRHRALRREQGTRGTGPGSGPGAAGRRHRIGA